MSSIIEAQAYTHDFRASDVTITNSDKQFQALIAFLLVMVIAALAGVVFTAPIITIAAGVTTAATVVYAAFASLTNNS